MLTTMMIRTVAVILAMQTLDHLGTSFDTMAFQNDIKQSEPVKAKRSILGFPPDSAFQVTMGISLAGNMKRNNAVIVLGFQQNAKLPNESQTTFLPEVVTAKQFSVYNHLANVISRYGFNGQECLNKMICQIAETPFGGGLLEDIINFVLSPSRHRVITDQKLKSENYESDFIALLLKSEALGKLEGNCSLPFPRCTRTPLDIISHFIKM